MIEDSLVSVELPTTTHFDLTYLQFNYEEYEKIFVCKILEFLNLIGLNRIDYLELFDQSIKAKLLRLVDNISCRSIHSLQQIREHGVQVIESPPINCRQRIRFAVRDASSIVEGKEIGSQIPVDSRVIEGIMEAANVPITLSSRRLNYVMWEAGSPSVVVKDFPIASVSIRYLMPIVLEIVSRIPVLADHLQAMHYLSSTMDYVIISLIYDHTLDNSQWSQTIQSLRTSLLNYIDNAHSQGLCPFRLNSLSFLGKSRNQKLTVGDSFVMEKLILQEYSPFNREYVYKQIENGFSNPNTVVNMKVLDWLSYIAREDVIPRYSETAGDTVNLDLLEMYCGNGNHTVALSEFYRRVLAVEINDALVDVAKENLTANGIQNAHILCFDSSYFANQILGKTTYYLDPFKKDRRTMKQARSKANRFVSQEPIADDSTDRIIFRFNTVLVDPPRAGLDDKTIKAVQQYDNIIYISCFPPKLLQDINKIKDTHKVIRIGIFDHFTYTTHLEVGVLLQKINMERPNCIDDV